LAEHVLRIRRNGEVAAEAGSRRKTQDLQMLVFAHRKHAPGRHANHELVVHHQVVVVSALPLTAT
jgi:hypothetical protein